MPREPDEWHDFVMPKAHLLFSTLLATTFAVVACSSSSTTTTGGGGAGTDSGGGGGGGAGSDSGGGGGGGGDTDSGGGGGGGDSMCGAAASLNACQTCCLGNHMTGAQTFTKSITACACKGMGAAADAGLGDGGAGPCATQCAATTCAATPANPDAPCNACLQASVTQGGACYDKVSTECNADADCAAEQACLQMQCKGKM